MSSSKITKKQRDREFRDLMLILTVLLLFGLVQRFKNYHSLNSVSFVAPSTSS